MNEIDTLIATLGRDARPTRPFARPVGAFAAWLLGACAYVALLVVLVFHPRPDLAEKVMQPLFAFEIAALALLAATTALSAALLSFPDSYQKRGLAYAPLAACAVFVGALALEWVTAPGAAAKNGVECCMAISVAALPPAAGMFIYIRRGASVHAALAGGVALLSAFSLGALALRLSEPTDSIAHLVLWHYLPMILVVALGLALGRKVFKW